MVAVKVLEVGKEFEVRTQYGPKNKVEIGLEQLDTKKQYKATMFVPKSGLEFKVGDEILADIVVNGQYINIKSVEKFSAPEIPQEIKGNDKVAPEVWEAKDRRMVRMNALSHAVEIVKLGIKGNDLTNSEITNFVIMEAEQLEQWIYSKPVNVSVEEIMG